MSLQTREKFCSEIIELAKVVKGITQKDWAAYPEREREKAEDALTIAKNCLKAIFED